MNLDAKQQRQLLSLMNSIVSMLITIPVRVIAINDDPDSVGWSRFDGKNGVIGINFGFQFTPKTTVEDAKMVLLGILTHEMLHLWKTDFEYERSQLTKYPTMEIKIRHEIANIVEDPAIEFQRHPDLSEFLNKSLDVAIGYFYRNGTNLGEQPTAFAEVMTSMIQFGDVGVLRGSFHFKEAQDAFIKIAPVMERAIEAVEYPVRFEKSMEIFDILKPLWIEHNKLLDANSILNNLLKAMGKNDAQSSGSNVDKSNQSSPSNSSNSASQRRKKTIHIVDPEENPDDMEDTNDEGDIADADDIYVSESDPQNADGTAEDLASSLDPNADYEIKDERKNKPEQDEAPDSNDEGAGIPASSGQESSEQDNPASEGGETGSPNENGDTASDDSTGQETSAPSQSESESQEGDSRKGSSANSTDGGETHGGESENPSQDESEKQSAGGSSQQAEHSESSPDGTSSGDAEEGDSGKDSSTNAIDGGETHDGEFGNPSQDGNEKQCADGSSQQDGNSGSSPDGTSSEDAEECETIDSVKSALSDSKGNASDGKSSGSLIDGESDLDDSSSGSASKDIGKVTDGSGQTLSEKIGKELKDLSDQLSEELADSDEFDVSDEDVDTMNRTIAAAEEFDARKLLREKREHSINEIDVSVPSPYYGEQRYTNIRIEDGPQAMLERIRKDPDIHSYILNLRNQFGKIFKLKSGRKEYKNSGRADVKRLCGRKLTARMFYKKTKPDDKSDMAIVILVDQSGSMSGCVQRVHETLIVLLEALKAYDVKVKVIGFTTHNNAVYYHYGNDDWKNDDKLERACTRIDASGGTFLGHALRYASVLLKKRPERNKFFICITDGDPNANVYSDYSAGMNDCRGAIQEIKKYASTIGVGIYYDKEQKDVFEYVFMDGCVSMESLDGLVKELPKRFKKLIS